MNLRGYIIFRMQEISYHSQGAAWLSDWLAVLLRLYSRMIFTLRMEPSRSILFLSFTAAIMSLLISHL